jgi:thioredoxin-dependent peroxiredoxin
MLQKIFMVLVPFCAGALMAGGAFADDLKVGDKAPDFTLQGTDGKTYSLSELKGRTVVLAWFPKAFTAG